MFKVLFVLTVLSAHADTAPVVISQHSSLEACQRAFKDMSVQMAQNTTSPAYKSTAMRTHSCTETEVWIAAREAAER